MSYANGTTHYNLPQTVGTDKRDWFDTNQAFADIDAALYGAVQTSTETATALDTLAGRVTTVEGKQATDEATLAEHTTKIGALETLGSQHTAAIADVRQDAEDMICAYNEGSAQTSTHAYAIGDYFIYNDVLYRATAAIAIGDTIVPNTNCVATNVSTEISEVQSNLDVSSDNTSLVGTYIMKQNRNVEIHFQGAYADDIAAFTLPSALRPQHDVRNTCMILTSDGTLLGLARVKADGTVEISAMATYGASLSAVTSHGSQIYGEIKFFTAS